MQSYIGLLSLLKNWLAAFWSVVARSVDGSSLLVKKSQLSRRRRNFRAATPRYFRADSEFSHRKFVATSLSVNSRNSPSTSAGVNSANLRYFLAVGRFGSRDGGDMRLSKRAMARSQLAFVAFDMDENAVGGETAADVLVLIPTASRCWKSELCGSIVMAGDDKLMAVAAETPVGVSKHSGSPNRTVGRGNTTTSSSF